MKNLIFIILALFISCQNTSNQSLSKSDSSITSQEQIIPNKLIIDSVLFDHIESSYLGNGEIYNDSIYFVDSKFCWVFKFDKNGKKIARYLGKGNGPKEIPTGEIDGFKLFCNGNSHIFWDPGLRFMKFNKDYEILLNGTIDRGIKYTKEQRLKNTRPEMQGIYTFTHGRNLTRYYEGYIYTTIYSEYPDFNPMKKSYYETARILAKISAKDGKIEDILGRYSPEYLNYKYVPQFANICYDISNEGKFYIGYEIDSLIYVTDKNLNEIGKFGKKGKVQNTNYLEVKSINEYFNNYDKEREIRGYYSWIEYIDELDLLCRTYTKGAESKNDGLQIYKDEQLIAEIEIPKGMKILGYIEPYVYSNLIIDELNEEMKVYRIKVK